MSSDPCGKADLTGQTHLAGVSYLIPVTRLTPQEVRPIQLGGGEWQGGGGGLIWYLLQGWPHRRSDLPSWFVLSDPCDNADLKGGQTYPVGGGGRGGGAHLIPVTRLTSQEVRPIRLWCLIWPLWQGWPHRRSDLPSWGVSSDLCNKADLTGSQTYPARVSHLTSVARMTSQKVRPTQLGGGGRVSSDPCDKADLTGGQTYPAGVSHLTSVTRLTSQEVRPTQLGVSHPCGKTAQECNPPLHLKPA